MKSKYMDFVPSKSATSKSTASVTPNKRSNTASVKPTTTKNTASRTTKRTFKPTSVHTPKATSTRTAKSTSVKSTTSARKSTSVGFSGEKKAKLGTIENLNTHFVRSDVPKRPLSRAAHFTTGKTGVAAAKARKVGMRATTSIKSVEKQVQNSVQNPVENSHKTAIYRTPNTPFIKQNQVTKRPLSKNVYPKKQPITPQEEPKGPVTIISKPEKDAHVGMIIAIILTIILGAAAGTVAFLLLPK